MKKTFAKLHEGESRKDALKRALAIAKWKKEGGKVEKQPPTPAYKGRGSYGGRGKGALSPMSKEDEKMAKDIKDYKKKMKGIPHFYKKGKNKKEEVGEGYQEISNLVDITQEVMSKMIKAMKKDDFKAVTKLYKELGNIIK